MTWPRAARTARASPEAVIWHGIGKISLEEVPDPDIRDPADAVVRITTSAICGTDLHFVRGTMGPMRNGVLTQQEALPSALEVYEAFDRRDAGWTKVALEVS